MSYKNKLQQLVEDVDGCTASFFCGYDGLLIDKFEKSDGGLDEIAAEWSSICSQIGPSQFKDMIITLNNGVLAIKPFEIGFVAIVLSPDGNVGRAKFELNKCRSDFEQ